MTEHGMQLAGGTWLNAVSALGGQPGLAGPGAADLECRYSEPHRRYHTIEHVQQVISDVHLLAGELSLGEPGTALALAAACAHDVVYDAQPGQDERASAAWAQQHLAAAAVPAAAGQQVADLVLATLDHAAAADDLAAQVLLDADLAILGSPAARYDQYVLAVRAEYARVPADQWRPGRAQVLQSLRDRADLYATPVARARWEAAARANLGRELASLGMG